MAYQNGRLPDSALAPIYGGRLTKNAAAAWNAMNAKSRVRYSVTFYPLGAASSYRTLAQQEYLWDHVPHAHDPAWVAVPGTSNHGWGIAVDLASRQMRWILDQIGSPYGWAKRWSDAPVEWWHIRWAEGVWKPGPTRHQLEAKALAPLGKKQRKAVQTLLWRRRRRHREARTGKGPQWHKWDRLVNRSYRKVERLQGRASGERKRVLSKALKDRNGFLTT